MTDDQFKKLENHLTGLRMYLLLVVALLVGILFWCIRHGGF